MALTPGDSGSNTATFKVTGRHKGGPYGFSLSDQSMKAYSSATS